MWCKSSPEIPTTAAELPNAQDEQDEQTSESQLQPEAPSGSNMRRDVQPIILPTLWTHSKTAQEVTRTLFLSGMQPFYDLSMLKFHFPKGSYFRIQEGSWENKAGAALTETSFR